MVLGAGRVAAAHCSRALDLEVWHFLSLLLTKLVDFESARKCPGMREVFSSSWPAERFKTKFAGVLLRRNLSLSVSHEI